MLENLSVVHNPVCEFHIESEEKWLAGLLVVVFIFTIKKNVVLNKRKKNHLGDKVNFVFDFFLCYRIFMV